jgi:adenylate cyclase class 2
MARNLEFKARVADLLSLEKVFVENGAAFVEDLKQKDTYFCVQKGRLKLREILGKKSELIFYERQENSSTSMQSNYEIFRSDDSLLKNILVKSLGVKVIVEKERRLLKLENARIHLDQVKGLGEFLEFEVVSGGDDAVDADLLNRLKKIARPFVIEGINRSYSDLVLSINS